MDLSDQTAFLVICSCCPGYPRREHFLNWNQRSHLVPSARRARILVCRGGCLPLDGKVLCNILTSRRVVRCKLLIAPKDVKIPDMMAITWKNACITKLFEKVLHLHNSIQYWNNENTINETNTYFGFTMLCFSSFFSPRLIWRKSWLKSRSSQFRWW